MRNNFKKLMINTIHSNGSTSSPRAEWKFSQFAHPEPVEGYEQCLLRIRSNESKGIAD